MLNKLNFEAFMKGVDLIMQITSGKIRKAQKIVVYGPEGIGKSTFAAQFPEALFIDTEGSTGNLDVRRLPKPTSWEMLRQEIDYVIANNVCKTLVIDTVDWAEQLCLESILAKYGKSGIEDFGYGNGYVYEKEEFGRFLNRLEDVIGAGINVVLTAHAHLRKFSQPDELGEYDRWELKLGKKTNSQISPLVKEWADAVLFVNYKTFAVSTDKEGKKFKAQGGGRVMYAQHHPCWDAKNRYGLPEETAFEYSAIARYIPDGSVPAQTAAEPDPNTFNADEWEELPVQRDTVSESRLTIPKGIPPQLADLMRTNGVSDEEIRFAVSNAGFYPEDMPIADYDRDFIMGAIVEGWQGFYKKICEYREVPFE